MTGLSRNCGREMLVNGCYILPSLVDYPDARSGIRVLPIGVSGISVANRSTSWPRAHLGFSTSIPLFNKKQGPIAEAEARRKQAAASFMQTQAQVIARGERALAVYTATLKEMADAHSLYQLQEKQAQMAEQSIRGGLPVN